MPGDVVVHSMSVSMETGADEGTALKHSRANRHEGRGWVILEAGS